MAPNGNGPPDWIFYFVAQPCLNVLFGFVFGLAAPWVIRDRTWVFWFWLWALLLVFVSVRIVGDWLMGVPVPAPGESFRLLLYATSFTVGLIIARLLRMVYGTRP
jgi:hypothetical protein